MSRATSAPAVAVAPAVARPPLLLLLGAFLLAASSPLLLFAPAAAAPPAAPAMAGRRVPASASAAGESTAGGESPHRAAAAGEPTAGELERLKQEEARLSSLLASVRQRKASVLRSRPLTVGVVGFGR